MNIAYESSECAKREFVCLLLWLARVEREEEAVGLST